MEGSERTVSGCKREEPPLIKLVHGILWDLERQHATEIRFESEWVARRPDQNPALLVLQDPRCLRGYLTPTHERMFHIRFFAEGEWRDAVAPSGALFLPMMRRLCLLSGIHYWAKGPVTGELRITLGQHDTRWEVRSEALDSGLALTRMEVEPAVPISLSTLPSLPEPSPEAPLPQKRLWPELYAEDSGESELAHGARKLPLVQFVDLLVYMAVCLRATQIVFESVRSRKTDTDQATWEDDQTGTEGFLTELEQKFPKRFPIRYFADGHWSAFAPPPVDLYRPVINRLCVQSGIRYWAKGSVSGYLSTVTVNQRSSWTVHSHSLAERLVLTAAPPEQVAWHEALEPMEIPKLPEPPRAEPLFITALRHTRTPTRTEAIGWFLARWTFYVMAQTCAVVILAAAGRPIPLEVCLAGLPLGAVAAWLLGRAIRRAEPISLDCRPSAP